ncbi:MAG TPA: ABC transporter ATP-binding protein [Polyangiales bacterium]
MSAPHEHASAPPPAAHAPWPERGSTVLACQGVVRELGAQVKTRVLDSIDLSVREREFVSLTGLSGSGKSTLLYLLGVLDRPSAGQILLDGIDVSVLDDDERARIRSEKLGFVFQFHFLLPEFSVLENVMIPMLRRGSRSEASARQKAREVLGQMGLSELWARKPSQLSGGQQQRVSVARAVANDPRIILADEPTGNLDSRNGEQVMHVFESLVREQGITVLMVTHERSFAARASRQLVMHDGKIVQDIDQRAPI